MACKWLGFALILLILPSFIFALGDPYKILGLNKHCTLQEIRKTYKQLAKEW